MTILATILPFALITLALGVIFNSVLPRWKRMIRALLLDDDP